MSRLATNRELAMWLSKGNGEICMSDIKMRLYLTSSFHITIIRMMMNLLLKYLYVHGKT